VEARIIGLKGCGKSTLLGALSEGRAEHAITTVKMGDARIRILSDMFHPKKTTFAEFQVKEVMWPEASGRKGEMDRYLDAVAGGQVFLHVVRAFESPLLSRSADAERDLHELDEQFLFADLLAIERAFERAKKQPMPDNVKRVLSRAKEALEADTPLRDIGLDEGELVVARNYQFLTLVPQLLLVNVEADGAGATPIDAEAARDRQVIAFPFTEALEVALLSPEEQLEFAEALGLPGPAADIVTHAAFTQMGYLSFFTVGEDEVRAWPVRRGEHARQAAGVIHSDLERGFIRAEVVSYDDFMQCGSMKACRDHGVLKIEGKDYVVQDGDILHVRFNI
jgi:ribosome-binding ATPase YchF (GTP1/OBG family)